MDSLLTTKRQSTIWTSNTGTWVPLTCLSYFQTLYPPIVTSHFLWQTPPPPPPQCPNAPPCYVVIVDRGTGVMFHSARLFIRVPGWVFSIWTASAIWRSIVSFLYVPVIAIWKSCTSPLCSSRQCRHNGEFSTFRPARFVICFCPRVYPFDTV